jgi:hypothetical protein
MVTVGGKGIKFKGNNNVPFLNSWYEYGCSLYENSFCLTLHEYSFVFNQCLIQPIFSKQR